MANMNNSLPASDLNLPQIAEKIACKEEELTQLLDLLPTGDVEDITYLEQAGRCILEVLGLIDRVDGVSSALEKMPLKLWLMGKLLELKALGLMSHPASLAFSGESC